MTQAEEFIDQAGEANGEVFTAEDFQKWLKYEVLWKDFDETILGAIDFTKMAPVNNCSYVYN